MRRLMGKVTALLAVVICLTVPTSAWAAGSGLSAAGVDDKASLKTQAVDYDISWYTGHTSPYTIKTLMQLKGLAYLVNEGTESFEGKEVRLGDTSLIIFEEGQSIDPIGTVEHPFEGTFDGRRGSAVGQGIVNLTINVGDHLENIGLFGYAGEHALIKNLSVYGGDGNPISVTNSTQGKVISNVGAIAGYLGGSIQNCYSSVEVSVTNDGAVADKTGVSKKDQKPEDLCTVLGVGGLAGTLRGNMNDCTHASDTDLRISSTADVDENTPYIAGYVGGLVGLQGDIDHPEQVTSLSNCKNAGDLVFNVSGAGGADRFGSQIFSQSTMVGGIVGYTMGNVSDCSNTAAVHTGIVSGGVTQAGWGASNTGGIVGSLRGPVIANPASASGVVGANETDPGYNVWKDSQGTSEAELITVSNCSNTGVVTGLASVAGICGNGGAFTQIVGCSNTAMIEGTRWNKPCPAGIVGIMNGDVRYCYNQGRCFSTTGGGYYAAGIAALLTTYNTSVTPQNMLLDLPELCGCYVTGSIGGTESGFRVGVIAGENDGYIHDNCVLPNLSNDKAKAESGFDDGEQHSRLVAKDENRGTLVNNHELSPDEMKSSLAVSYLNKPNAKMSDWSLYYVPVPGRFPVLSWQAADMSLADPIDLKNVVSGIGEVVNPEFSAVYAPVPVVALTTTTGDVLYQDADYRVVVDDASREVGGSYVARIEGINGYTGTLSQSVTYTIAKADIGNCVVTATPKVFNWERQIPDAVIVTDELGNVVDPSEYTFETLPNEDGSTKKDKDGKYHDYINCHGANYRYDVKVTALPSSPRFTGETTQAAFQIKWASMFYSVEDVNDNPNLEESVVLGDVVHGDKTWGIRDAIKNKGSVKIKYTGSEIRPKFASVTYLGREMRDGTDNEDVSYHPLNYDYKYVYGNPNPELDKDANGDSINVTGSAETDLGCVTVRFTTGGNFDNYTNVFYEIVPASIASDVKVTGVNASYAYTGSAIRPTPKLTYNGMTLKSGADYTISYKNNTAAGKATITLTGKGNYAGTKTVTFNITRANIASVKAAGVNASYTYKGSAIKPVPKLTYNGKTLKSGTDYTISYKNNTAAGKATITLAGKGNYTGTKTVAFTIARKSIASGVKITGVKASYVYRGALIKPVPKLTFNGVTLKSGTHYTLAYKNNKVVGKASVVLTGKGNFTGTKTVAFRITKAAQPMVVKTAAKAAGYSKVKSKAQVVTPITIKNAKGTVTCKKVSTNKVVKGFKVDAKGKVTVPKGTRAGSYPLIVKVICAGNSNYKSASKTVKVTVKVK